MPKGKCFLGDVGFAVSNGPAFSLDGNTMYFNDSAGKKAGLLRGPPFSLPTAGKNVSTLSRSTRVWPKALTAF